MDIQVCRRCPGRRLRGRCTLFSARCPWDGGAVMTGYRQKAGRPVGRWRPASVGYSSIVPAADPPTPLASVIFLSLLVRECRRAEPEPFDVSRSVLVGNEVGGYRVLVPIGTLYEPVRTAGGFGTPAFRQQSRFYQRELQVGHGDVRRCYCGVVQRTVQGVQTELGLTGLQSSFPLPSGGAAIARITRPMDSGSS